MIAPGSNEILVEPGKQIAASNEDYISSDLIKVTERTRVQGRNKLCIFQRNKYFPPTTSIIAETIVTSNLNTMEYRNIEILYKWSK